MAKQVAIKKRALIDKANRNMFIAVCVASLVLGFSVVGAIYLVKWTAFNAKVIGEKQAILKDYDTSIANLTKLSEKVMNLADNENLESVARGEGCVKTVANEEDSTNVAERLGECTALRVVPDALPSVKNQEATLASLNKIFILSGMDPETLGTGDNYGGASAPVDGIEVLPANLSMEGEGSMVKNVLSNIERSIRAYDIRTATIEFRGDINNSIIMLRGQVSAYYSDEVMAAKLTRTVKATGGATTKK